VNDQRWSAAALLPPEETNTTLSEMAYHRLESRLDSTSLALGIDVDLRKLGLKKNEMDEETLDELMAPTHSGTIWANKSPLGSGGHIGAEGIIEGEDPDRERKGYSRVSKETDQIEDGGSDKPSDK